MIIGNTPENDSIDMIAVSAQDFENIRITVGQGFFQLEFPRPEFLAPDIVVSAAGRLVVFLVCGDYRIENTRRQHKLLSFLVLGMVA